MTGLEKWLLASPAWAVFTQRVVVARVLAGGVLPDEADVLELGCGAGGETEALARRFRRWRITATDYDADMVDHAARRLAFLGERIRVEQADATRLPYANAAFDVVVAILVWHHVGDWPAATAEVSRVLRPGGAFLLADVAVPEVIARRAPQLAPSGAYTLLELRAVLAESGLEAPVRVGRRKAWFRMLARR